MNTSWQGCGWSRASLAAGLLQVAAVLTPAARAPLVGYVSFVRLPTAGVALIALGILTASTALRPHGWWRWLPGIFSGVVVAIAYWRIVYAPSDTFADVLLRRAVHPAWGFVPMSLAVALSLCCAALVRTPQPPVAIEPPLP